MYESFYGFSEKPFSTLPDPDFLYLSKKHEMALTYLEYGLSSQAGFTVLTGEIGSGKTTLLNYLMKKLDAGSANIALIFNTNIQPDDLLRAVLREWDVPYDQQSKAELYELLNNFLIKEYQKGTSVVLIIDEAQNLPAETLEEIRMISNLNDEKIPLLHIILSGQPNLKKRLNSSEFEQLRQRISIHYNLDPLDQKEIFTYIEHRLTQARAQNMNVFTPEAIQTVFQYSRGIPRIINLLCDLALVYGFAEQIKPIDKTIIETVVKDRRSMGLDVETVPSHDQAGPEQYFSKSDVFSFEKKYTELHDNLYDLALIVRKLVKTKEVIDRHGKEIKRLEKNLKALEQKMSGSIYQKMFKDIMQQWNTAHGKTNGSQNG